MNALDKDTIGDSTIMENTNVTGVTGPKIRRHEPMTSFGKFINTQEVIEEDYALQEQEDKIEDKEQAQKMGSPIGFKDGSWKVEEGIGCGRALPTQTLELRSRPVTRSQTRRYEQMTQDDDINKGLNPIPSIHHFDPLSTTKLHSTQKMEPRLEKIGHGDQERTSGPGYGLAPTRTRRPSEMSNASFRSHRSDRSNISAQSNMTTRSQRVARAAALRARMKGISEIQQLEQESEQAELRRKELQRKIERLQLQTELNVVEAEDAAIAEFEAQELAYQEGPCETRAHEPARTAPQTQRAEVVQQPKEVQEPQDVHRDIPAWLNGSSASTVSPQDDGGFRKVDEEVPFRKSRSQCPDHQ